MLLPFSVVVDCTLFVCVSLLPHVKHVTWRWTGRVAHGVSGPITSGWLEAATACSIPIRSQAQFGFRALAISTWGQSSWKWASPPLPAARWTERVVAAAEAA